MMMTQSWSLGDDEKKEKCILFKLKDHCRQRLKFYGSRSQDPKRGYTQIKSLLPCYFQFDRLVILMKFFYKMIKPSWWFCITLHEYKPYLW